MVNRQSFDRHALIDIYEQYSPRLYCYAVRLLGDSTLAEECVSDTFCRYLHILKAGKGPSISPRAYLYRMAHNWITDFYRRPPPQAEPLSDDLHGYPHDDPIQVVARQDERDQVRKALLQLSSDQQQVILLRFLDGFSFEEIGAIVGKSVDACKMLQYRALNALRGLLIRKQE